MRTIEEMKEELLLAHSATGGQVTPALMNSLPLHLLLSYIAEQGVEIERLKRKVAEHIEKMHYGIKERT